MRIPLRYRGQHLVLDVQRDGDCYRVHDGSADRVVRAEILNRDSLLLDVDGQRHNVAFVRSDDTFLLAIGGETYTFARERSEGAGNQVTSIASPEIVAPMPGKVIQIMVKPGQAIASGDTLVILEAMKMENRLLAEAPGIVEAVRVNAGDLVQGGQVLAVIKYA